MAHPWTDGGRPIHPGTVKEGYLVKSPPLNKKGIQYKQWKRRWCVFISTGKEPPCLLYFTDKEAVLSGSMPINRVLLDSCFKVEHSLQHSSHQNLFAVHLPERIFYFSAPSQKDMEEWVHALSTHLRLQVEEKHLSRIEGWVTLPRTSQRSVSEGGEEPPPLPQRPDTLKHSKSTI